MASPIKLRPKTLEILRLLAANAGRVLSKQQLMEAVWPNIHVGEDSLFQCIRELRSTLGDDKREMIRVVSGRGYFFQADTEFASGRRNYVRQRRRSPAWGTNPATRAVEQARPRWPFGLRGPAMAAALAGLCAVVGFAAAAPIFRPDLIFGRSPPTVAVMPIVDVSGEDQGTITAAGVTERLIDGLARIGNIRVVAPPANTAASPAEGAAGRAASSDLSVHGELRKEQQSWTLQARMIRTATREVEGVVTVSVDIKDADAQLQQSRLAAGVGHPLALRLNALLEAGSAADPVCRRVAGRRYQGRDRAGDRGVDQTNDPRTLCCSRGNAGKRARCRSRQHRSRGCARSTAPARHSVGLAVRSGPARGGRDQRQIDAGARVAGQTGLYSGAGGLLPLSDHDQSVRRKPRGLREDIELRSVERAGSLPHRSHAVLLGRFTDGLASFEQADRFDTPQVSRWVWLLGAGMANMLLGRNEDAVRWLHRSIAITPASGRTHLLLAAAYQKLGKTEQAREAMEKARELRPGSTYRNVPPPTKNSSQAYLDASERIMQLMVAAGLPES